MIGAVVGGVPSFRIGGRRDPVKAGFPNSVLDKVRNRGHLLFRNREKALHEPMKRDLNTTSTFRNAALVLVGVVAVVCVDAVAPDRDL